MAGGRLIKKLFDAYVASYGTDEKPYIPIFTNARDQTSYPILKANAERMAKEKGLVAKVVEIGTHDRGGDTMHDVLVAIGKTEAEVDKQITEFRRSGGIKDVGEVNRGVNDDGEYDDEGDGDNW
ncbi:MAG: hypothetical protein Q7S66_01790 [bacterium]|nr:hypothetical protein [bacterium]